MTPTRGLESEKRLGSSPQGDARESPPPVGAQGQPGCTRLLGTWGRQWLREFGCFIARPLNNTEPGSLSQDKWKRAQRLTSDTPGTRGTCSSLDKPPENCGWRPSLQSSREPSRNYEVEMATRLAVASGKGQGGGDYQGQPGSSWSCVRRDPTSVLGELPEGAGGARVPREDQAPVGGAGEGSTARAWWHLLEA